MKVIIVFKSGTRVMGDTLAMILPEPPINIDKRYELDHATDEEIEKLQDDPYNDELLQEIANRGKIK